MIMNKKVGLPFVKIALVLVMVAFLTIACGGGGGGGDDDDDDQGTTTYQVSGTVTGLAGELILELNDGIDLSVTENGTFTFSTYFQNSASYAVTIEKHPDEQTCRIYNASGIVNGATVSDINVACTTTISMNFTLKGLYDQNIRWPSDIIKHGDYAYVADQSGVKIFDVFDPSNIQYLDAHAEAGSFEIVGSTAYSIDYEDLHIIDLTTPDDPQLITTYDVGESTMSMVADGGHVYITMFDNPIMQVINVSNPSIPTLATTYSFDGVLLSAKNGYVYGYTPSNSYTSNFQIIDMSDPQNPLLRGSYPLYHYINEIIISDDYAYIAGNIDEDENSGLIILSITDIDNIQLISKIETDGYAFDVSINGNYAYMGGGTEGLEIIDISNPSSPARISHSEVERVNSFYFDSGYLYALGTRSYRSLPMVMVISVINPATPAVVATYTNTNYGKDMAYQGDYLFLSNEGDHDLQGLDISNPAQPIIAAESDAPSPTHYFNTSDSFILYGTYAYQSGDAGNLNNEGGVRLWDLSDPEQPDFVKVFSNESMPSWIHSMDIDGNVAYLAAPNNGLCIGEIVDPEDLDCVLFDSAPFVSIDRFIPNGSRACAVGSYNVHLYDISNQQLPVLMGSYQTEYSEPSIFVEGDYLYVLDDPIEIVDISDYTNPTLIGEYAGASGRYAQLVGNKLYVAGNRGLSVFDVTDPTYPTIIGKYNLRGGGIRLHVEGSLVYVLLEHGGIRILEEI